MYYIQTAISPPFPPPSLSPYSSPPNSPSFHLPSEKSRPHRIINQIQHNMLV